MRILFFITDLRGGGAQKVVITLARGLVERGHDVHLLLVQGLLEYDVPQGVTLHTLIERGKYMHAGWLGKRLLAKKLGRWINFVSMAQPFDMMIVSLPFASEIAWLAGLKPVYHHIHNSLSREIAALKKNNDKKARRRTKRYRAILEHANLIAVSKGVADDLKEQIGLKYAQITTIYNPFDLQEIQRQSGVYEPDLPGKPYIIHAGRFSKQKRHDLLLDAYLASGIDHDLVLLTKECVELTKLIDSRDLSSRVVVAGFRANPFPWYAHASALVLSSDFEGFGNVLVEALACGIPVVSTDCSSGPSEILTGSLAQFLSPPNNIGYLAHKIRQVIDAPPKIDPLIVNRFSLDHALDRLEALAHPD